MICAAADGEDGARFAAVTHANNGNGFSGNLWQLRGPKISASVVQRSETAVEAARLIPLNPIKRSKWLAMPKTLVVGRYPT